MKIIDISLSSVTSGARWCAFSLCGLVVAEAADTRRWLRHAGLPANLELALGVPLALIALASDYLLSLRGHGMNMDGYIAAYLLATAPLISLWWHRLRRGWRVVRRSMKGLFQPTFSVSAMTKTLDELGATPSVLSAFSLVPVLTTIGFMLNFPLQFLVQLSLQLRTDLCSAGCISPSGWWAGSISWLNSDTSLALGLSMWCALLWFVGRRFCAIDSSGGLAFSMSGGRYQVHLAGADEAVLQLARNNLTQSLSVILARHNDRCVIELQSFLLAPVRAQQTIPRSRWCSAGRYVRSLVAGRIPRSPLSAQERRSLERRLALCPGLLNVLSPTSARNCDIETHHAPVPFLAALKIILYPSMAALRHRIDQSWPVMVVRYSPR